MSDDNKPKQAPVEGRTQAFRLKIDGWMSELISQDFDLEQGPPGEEGAQPATLGEPGKPTPNTK